MSDSLAKESTEDVTLDYINQKLDGNFKILNKYIYDSQIESEKRKRIAELSIKKDLQIKKSILQRIEKYNYEQFKFKNSLEENVRNLISKEEISNIIDSKFKEYNK